MPMPDKPVQLVAQFGYKKYEVTATVDPEEKGTVYLVQVDNYGNEIGDETAGSIEIEYAKKVKMRVECEEGYELYRWNDLSGTGRDANPRTLSLIHISLKATPNQGYGFNGWIVDGVYKSGYPEIDIGFKLNNSVNVCGYFSEYSSNGDLMTGYLGTDAKITIPSKLPDHPAGKAIKRITNGAFQNTNIEEVTIPASITHIGLAAFRNNDNLDYAYFEGTNMTFNEIMALNTPPPGMGWLGKILWKALFGGVVKDVYKRQPLRSPSI